MYDEICSFCSFCLFVYRKFASSSVRSPLSDSGHPSPATIHIRGSSICGLEELCHQPSSTGDWFVDLLKEFGATGSSRVFLNLRVVLKFSSSLSQTVNGIFAPLTNRIPTDGCRVTTPGGRTSSMMTSCAMQILKTFRFSPVYVAQIVLLVCRVSIPLADRERGLPP